MNEGEPPDRLPLTMSPLVLPHGVSGQSPTTPSAMTSARDVIALRRALALEPERGDLRLELAAAYLELGRPDEAARTALPLIEAGLSDVHHRVRLAWILASAGLGEPAAEALTNLPQEGALALELARRAGFSGHWRGAEALYRRAAELEPGCFEAHHGHSVAQDYLGDAAGALGTIAAATELFRAHPPLLAILRFHKAQDLMLQGRLEEGWAALEARLETAGGPRLTPRPEPTWNGSPLAGRPLLLRWDQGYGDAFMMIRFAARLARCGERIFLECPEAARDVLATSGVEPVPGDGSWAAPPGTVQLPLCSLPHRMRIGWDDVPEPEPYLRVPGRVPGRDVLDALLDRVGGRRLGLVWAGNPEHGRTAERDLPATLLSALAALPGLSWFSLQKGAAPPAELSAVDLGPHLQTFSDTAHTLSCLDALVTVDTSVAHLAGALGVRTWLLLPKLPDWRWLLDREDSPWYPTLRLRRQPEHGAWEAVLARLAPELMTIP